ncbi:MAG: hypothetical protein IKP46_09215 [Bacteroidales bacterium]|nr:hypothetical protein [Bacteroidales bacterium]
MKKLLTAIFVLAIAAVAAYAQTDHDPEPYELAKQPFTTVKTPSGDAIKLIYEGDIQGVTVTCAEGPEKNFTVHFINSNDFRIKMDYVLQTAVSNGIRVGNITIPAGGTGVCKYTTQFNGDILASVKMTISKSPIGEAVIKSVTVTHHADSLLNK